MGGYTMSVIDPIEYVLVGYFRFVIDGASGVIGEVVSQYTPGWAEDSTVPVYRKLGETKASLDKESENM